MAIQEKEFENCTNHKPCNSVIYTVLDRGIQRYKYGNNYVQIGFNDLLVEVIKDSYVHTFISIFSEIGGSLGVLVGVSCMSVVEFMINIYTNLCSKCKNIFVAGKGSSELFDTVNLIGCSAL